MGMLYCAVCNSWPRWKMASANCLKLYAKLAWRSHGKVWTAMGWIAKPSTHQMNQSAGVDFSRLDTADTPSASRLIIAALLNPKISMWSTAMRECQKKLQFGASRLPTNHAPQ